MSLCDKCIHKDVCKNVTNVNESEGVVCPNRLVILFLWQAYLYAKKLKKVIYCVKKTHKFFEEDDDWTALKERPFEGRPGTDA